MKVLYCLDRSSTSQFSMDEAIVPATTASEDAVGAVVETTDVL
jgi:hypothetical protein